MLSYPSLSTEPNYPLKEIIDDAGLKTKTESGYVTTRRKYTKVSISFDITYSMLTDTDKDALRAFYDTVYTVDTFTWVHPYTAVSYTVRFDTVPTFELKDNNLWEVNFVLRST